MMKVLNNIRIVTEVCEYNGLHLYKTDLPYIEIISKVPLTIGLLYPAMLVEEGMRGDDTSNNNLSKKFYRVVKIHEQS